ncbi:AT-rich interactive domain-containing protein 5A isoform X2 [Notolabrus celidotus]|uniref:AT-rich interactive domain-containing protein 5A isoform X2 n=1 Tax=Notolabrus celidotus TaxID=1203425 RepID=UPI00148F8171|nr:AT-rich interactive domain-containing protein 5A isoform X2 [Notolabrus celidotus]
MTGGQLLDMDPEDHSETSQQTVASDEEHRVEDQVTARRLWKKVYDELGGSPGSTSAATCTRRHYEKLVLPFERHIKGEEDKPLPPSKPRKPYKRTLDSKLNKPEKKKKRSQLESEMDSEGHAQESPEAACQSEAVSHPHHALWSSDRLHLDSSQPKRANNTTIYTRLVPVPTSSPWAVHIPSTVGEVISPLEKKKRMAQASLNLPPSPQSEDKERPSVIHCSQSPSRASSNQNYNSSDGSPLPLSSSSSRSPSPYSVSSEDGPEGSEDKPATELPKNCSSSAKNASSSSVDSKSAGCSQVSKDPVGQRKGVPQACAQSADLIKVQIKDTAWGPILKEGGKYITHPFHPPPSYVMPGWPTSSSSFTKVIPKSVQLLRPAPIRPGYKIHQDRSMKQDDSHTTPKKQNNMAPWIYHTEKRDKSRTMRQKVPLTQQSVPHSVSSIPVSTVLPSFERSGRDPRHQLHPAFLHHRMRLPESQLMYRHVLPHSGSAVYPYPYSIPLLNPQFGYALPAMSPIYPHKM